MICLRCQHWLNCLVSSHGAGRGRRLATLSVKFGRFAWRTRSLPRAASEGDSEGGVVDGRLHRRHAVLAVAEVVASSPSPLSRRRSSPSSTRGRHHRPHDGSSSARRQLSRRMDDYRGLRSLDVSDGAFRLISDGWRSSSQLRYDRVWSGFRRFLRSRRLRLDQVDLAVVCDYLSLMFDKGLALRTIKLHRSVPSVMLPPIEGFDVGQWPSSCDIASCLRDLQRSPTILTAFCFVGSRACV